MRGNDETGEPGKYYTYVWRGKKIWRATVSKRMSITQGEKKNEQIFVHTK